MTRGLFIAITHAAALLLTGCAASEPFPGPDALAVLEEREIPAPRDRVLEGVVSVMLDEGLMFTLADSDAGVIGASGLVTTLEQRNRTGSVNVVVWARETAPDVTTMRLRVSRYGEVVVDPQRVSEFWIKVHRRVLGYEPIGDWNAVAEASP